MDPKPNRPPKIPPRSDRRPFTKSKSDEPPAKSYHFDLKLKPETVPAVGWKCRHLARWLNKINRLADGSVDVHRELGKIVPRRFTGSAETWYYSIPDYECVKGEVNWSCLGRLFQRYWMNQSLARKAKNSKPIKPDSGKSVTSARVPSEYIIRKLELIGLVYNLHRFGTIQAIMEEIPILGFNLKSPIPEIHHGIPERS